LDPRRRKRHKDGKDWVMRGLTTTTLSSNIKVMNSRRMRWTGHAVHRREMIKANKILVGKPEQKRPFGRPRRRWKDNIKTNLREMVREGVEWMHLAQERDQWRVLVNTVMKLWDP
jgi:hypothetical protein